MLDRSPHYREVSARDFQATLAAHRFDERPDASSRTTYNFVFYYVGVRRQKIAARYRRLERYFVPTDAPPPDPGALAPEDTAYLVQLLRQRQAQCQRYLERRRELGIRPQTTGQRRTRQELARLERLLAQPWAHGPEDDHAS